MPQCYLCFWRPCRLKMIKTKTFRGWHAMTASLLWSWHQQWTMTLVLMCFWHLGQILTKRARFVNKITICNWTCIWQYVLLSFGDCRNWVRSSALTSFRYFVKSRYFVMICCIDSGCLTWLTCFQIGSTPLFHACLRGHLKAARRLLCDSRINLSVLRVSHPSPSKTY